MGIVIGLHGAKGSGKDHFFKAAKKSFPDLDVRKIAYADPIKDQVCRIFDLASEEQYDLFKRTDVEYTLPHFVHGVPGRQVVREIGMLMRSYDPQQFVRYVEDQVKQSPQAIWCVTDVRFANEYTSIKTELGGVIVKVRRPNFTFDGHVTETEISDAICDLIIDNDQTLDNYENVIRETISLLINERKNLCP